MRVVCTHPDNHDGAFVDVVPSMPTETEALMSYQRSRAMETRAMEHEDTIHDPLGGAGSQEEHDMSQAAAAYGDYMEEEFMSDLQTILQPEDRPPTPLPEGSPSSPFMADLQPVLPPVDAPPTPLPIGAPSSPTHGEAHPGPAEASQAELTQFQVGSSAEALARCRKRRFLPGADTTDQNFEDMFTVLDEQADQKLSDVQSSRADSGASILTRTQALEKIARAKFPAWTDEMVRLSTAALAVYRMRLVDMASMCFWYGLWREIGSCAFIVESHTSSMTTALSCPSRVSLQRQLLVVSRGSSCGWRVCSDFYPEVSSGMMTAYCRPSRMREESITPSSSTTRHARTLPFSAGKEAPEAGEEDEGAAGGHMPRRRSTSWKRNEISRTQLPMIGPHTPRVPCRRLVCLSRKSCLAKHSYHT